MSKFGLMGNLFVENNVTYTRPKKEGFTFINIFLIILGIACLMYAVGMMLMGSTVFVIFWILSGMFFLGLGIIRSKRTDIHMARYVILRKVFYTFLWVGIICFVALEAIIIVNGTEERIGSPNIVMVLGAGLRGETPTATLAYRLDTAAEYLKKNNSAKVIVSGGQGKDEMITEASAMEKYLINCGIESERIIKEEQSINTKENFQYTRKKLDEEGYDKNEKVLIVTNSFHMARAKLLAERNGFEAYGESAPSYPYLIPNSYAREAFALIKTYLFDK
ncbi:DUF218 domain-containing protein [Hathewaya proteolytica DSM 3090]|uniref:DUF218 domain-containing protein n=1 Tax=Hathewaya proteolytica DSM 3090 TaxID=1121331 RepID=A0A1M6RFC4_9CLOT|nr:YdcF family protein [Hathewaya proteolytica]SHK31078.1 DUF218 domain-containing protein [Hathewaya proteolytica DSM 3090]